MNKKISLLLPTRGRPFLVRRLFQSIIDRTEDLKNIEIVLCLDDDDIESHQIEDKRLNIVKIIGPRTTMGEYNSKCLKNSTGDLIMLLNDDLVVRTDGWDRMIRDFSKQISDDIFMAYPDDMELANLSTFPIMSRKTCDLLIEPYPKAYDCQFIDDHIFDIFTRLKYLGENRTFYLKNIVFDHRHFIDGKVRPDVSYDHKNRYQDYIRFLSMSLMRQSSARRLLANIQGKNLPKLKRASTPFKEPKSNLQAVKLAFNVFILDHGLPLSRRIRWFIRFSKYYGAMKGGIPFFRRKTYLLYGS